MTSSRIPVYMQVADSLLERIEQGGWAPGYRMAPERTLAEEFGVNRRTVRQALSVLERRGLVERRQGSGTFICEPRLERGAAELFHFTEGIRQRGFAAGSQVLSLERVVPSQLAAEELELPAGADIYRCHRLRTVNGLPVLIETFAVPADLVPGFAELDFSERLVYEIMRTEYGIQVEHARLSLEAVAMSEIEAQWLGAALGAPAMLERRLAFDETGRPVDYGTDLYRGDRVRFVTDAATAAVPVSVDPSTGQQAGAGRAVTWVEIPGR